MALLASSKETMSESKGDIKGLGSTPEIGDIASYYKDTGNESTDTLVKSFLNESLASKMMVPFDVGSSKVRLYGQPFMMAKLSPLVTSILDIISYKEAMPLAPSVVVSDPASLLYFWLYLNGISDAPLEPTLDTWEWINYFGVNLLNEAVLQWIFDIGFKGESKAIKEYKGDRTVMCERLKKVITENIDNIGPDSENQHERMDYINDMFKGLSVICGERVSLAKLNVSTYAIIYSQTEEAEELKMNDEFAAGMFVWSDVHRELGLPRASKDRVRYAWEPGHEYGPGVDGPSMVYDKKDPVCGILRYRVLDDLLRAGYTNVIMIADAAILVTQDALDGYKFTDGKMKSLRANTKPFQVFPLNAGSKAKC